MLLLGLRSFCRLISISRGDEGLMCLPECLIVVSDGFGFDCASGSGEEVPCLLVEDERHDGLAERERDSELLRIYNPTSAFECPRECQSVSILE